ncbi:MAG TPA: DUF2934 domain-containing protein [Candidatus Omnitrophota bacterium]|nr:DUF2934 domain-containing protein [Candidatus Omnitrophota bacterium]
MAKSSFKLTRSSTSGASKDDLRKLIEKKAYELYEKRGKKPGYAMNDWLEAERIVKAKFSS